MLKIDVLLNSLARANKFSDWNFNIFLELYFKQKIESVCLEAEKFPDWESE